MRYLLFAFALISCEVEQSIVPVKVKIACLCNDGTRIVWDENIMRQTGWTTGNPCYDKGGIKEYIYK